MTMTPGITAHGEGMSDLKWNILGQTYTPKLHSENTFIWHALLPADSFVPPHIHPTQDEWITLLDGELELAFGDQVLTARAGDTVRMPMGIAHGITNKSGKDANCFFGVAPSRKLFDLFNALHDLGDPDEVVRLSALHEVNFLPPPAG
ncbi:cupin domain-containing protein [Maritalea sp.]|uniref:cupin domain-containing protein n=1 Tax=Maritalea sp. TaxID=2003361 RepID=UPI003EF13782